MWSQFLPNLSSLQNNLPENNVEDLAGTCSTLFSMGLFLDQFLLDLIKNFFGARFWYKLMCYYFYHRSNLREIIRFLRKIKCIEFKCNKFVVLVQIDLIHLEHLICISSTWIKTNTNPLHSRLIHTIPRKIGHVIQSNHINLFVKPFQHSVCIRSIWMKSNTEISLSAVGQSALPTLWGLGHTSTERRNGVGFW